MMTVMTMMIRMRPVMKTLIVASFALPMLSNVAFEMHIRTRKRCGLHEPGDQSTVRKR